MAGELVLAIDVGGTKLAAAVVGRDGTLLAAERCPSQPAIMRPCAKKLGHRPDASSRSRAPPLNKSWTRTACWRSRTGLRPKLPTV